MDVDEARADCQAGDVDALTSLGRAESPNRRDPTAFDRHIRQQVHIAGAVQHASAA